MYESILSDNLETGLHTESGKGGELDSSGVRVDRTNFSNPANTDMTSHALKRFDFVLHCAES